MSIRSASVQSHLSALNSQPRHRDPRPSTANLEFLPKANPTPNLARGSLLPVSDGPLTRPRFWRNSFRWIFSAYIAISLAFFSASLYCTCYASLFLRLHSTAPRPAYSFARSRLNVLSPAARLAKLVSLHPPPKHFGPFVYRSLVDPHPHEVTACLWTSESNLDWVPSWTNDWLGPISLVVVSQLAPVSTRASDHPALSRLLHHPMLNASRLTLHVLHLDPTTPEAPNVFLNLARLFAPTRTLLVVPGTPEPPPPTSIKSLSISHVRDPVVVRAAAIGPGRGIAADKRRPATLAALSPIVIPRDHPFWCVERFAFVPAPAASRAADWDACLWQVQVETFGAATINGPTLRGWRWDIEAEPAEPALPSVSFIKQSGFRHKLDVRYRVETCVLAIKRLELLGEEWHSGGHGRVGARLGRKSAEKMRWLHEVCREWSHGAQ
ncbi:hypothetical protein F5148DRAFT_1182501 [Russula earlei]|uniref:Uncharacterized protein n=1 Tax=Russula earlei TaxID=71964 RepID=A0ACC0UF21_9AGAM|nr:hypothetical protein F5148DRAFT_1182501 [Russula earlei]